MYAHKLFGPKITFAYNTLIRAHASTSPSLAFSLFTNMHRTGVSPDHFTFPFVLKAYSRLQTGHQTLHTLILKLGFHSNIYVNNSLIHSYGSSSLLSLACKLFDEMPHRDLVSWSSMISCLNSNGFSLQALALFQQMQIDGNVKPDEVTMLSVVSSVSNLGDLELGKWVGGYVSRSDSLELTTSLGTALIDMYSKCGCVDDSIKVFDKMPDRNVLTWTALINGLAVHGRGKEALRLYYEMKRYNLQPDHITFTGVLVACSYAGLVDDGREIFNTIKNEYRIEPTVEHYGCMVDLLGRAGNVFEAFEFVESMPCKPNAVIWRTLLGACVNHNHLVLAEKIKEKINELDPYHDGDYVLLSNAYGEVGRYNEKAEIRKSMREKRISKEPGYSLLDRSGISRVCIAR
ncbi:pentatricopeptide repeat-containing protein At4g21065-like [Mercurialis annua]|uniref:pentatricopeptide repeat-containing protein At4g21065-like n=1 Tax=Mercurialis annua TaxID=3986 RepID=UPI00215E7CFD|nr:pentatricopeptide repeat-containing protein At4g21065-like [Mercurialis annua]